MENVLKLDRVEQYNDLVHYPTLHPLVSVIDFSQCPLCERVRFCVGFYTVFLKDVKCGDIQYGRRTYDYQEGTLVFLAPGQCVGFDNRGVKFQPKGWALLFHPDLLRGTQLGRNIRNYTFFSYEVREALHLSEQERRTILDCLHNIRHELQHAIDRQFITRSDVAGKDILARFERTLDDYFLSDKPQTEGLPTVQYCAQELHLSANYFGDLVKRLTGKTAQEHIRLRLIDAAKERIADPARSIAEVAYELGFKYPAHFTRLFKNVVGCTPNRYRRRFD